MNISDLSPKMVLIVIIGVFIGSFVDAAAGGGGIITLPTYLLAGLPAHFALGTNKLSASIGTFISSARYIKRGYVDWALGIPSMVLALIGSHFGTKLQLMVSEKYLQYVLLIVIPAAALFVLRQRAFPEVPGEINRKKQMLIVYSSALVIGAYDGFYGPGTGTFLLLIFCNLAKMDVRSANGCMKMVNLGSNIGAVVTSLVHHKVFLALGCIGAAASVIGHYVGAGFAIRKGSKVVRPIVIFVLILLVIKVAQSLLTA